MRNLTPDLVILNKRVHVEKANEAFYDWEKAHYIRETPFSDDDRQVWVMGYLAALKELERIEK
jgi:hypothetical protein